MIEVVIGFLVLMCIYCMYSLFRNERVYRMRISLIEMRDVNNDKVYWKQKEIYDRYSYLKMLYSFRSVNSFRKELVRDINKVKENE